MQSSRGDGTSGSPTSVTGSIIPLTVTCNGFTINLVSDDWSVAEPTSHQFTNSKTPGPTSAAKCSGNQTAGDLFADYLLGILSLAKLMAMLRHVLVLYQQIGHGCLLRLVHNMTHRNA